MEKLLAKWIDDQKRNNKQISERIIKDKALSMTKFPLKFAAS